MPTVPVPLFGPVHKSVDGIELSDHNAELTDGYMDELGFSHKRPGLSSFVDLGSNGYVDGLYWWPHKEYVIAVSLGKAYKITYSDPTVTATDLSSSTLSANIPVSFATDGTYVFMAADGKIAYTNGTASVAFLADADAPTSVTHVAYLDGYILANNRDTNKFYWSDVNDSLNWTASSFASAAGNADYITALHVMNREVFLFGPSSLEVWENNGSDPFARVPGGFHEVGTIAPHSVARHNSALYWLSDTRAIYKYENGRLERVSNTYSKEIEGYTTVKDCEAHRIEIDGLPFIVWKFKTEGKTLAYNILQDNWSEWNYWDQTNGMYKRWLGGGYCYAPLWGKHLVGSANSELVYEMSASTYQDNGDPIRFRRRTGHIDYGTSKLKRSNEFRIRLKRGSGLSGSDAKFMVRWNDDNKGWSNEKWISLGNVGESEIIQRLHRTGIFRTRQYEFVATDNVDVVFGDAEEDLEILR